MHNLYALKENLIKELSDYGMNGGLTASSLDVIDKLAHAAKNVSKVIECCDEEGYSGATGHSYRDVTKDYVKPDGSYRHDGMSYARGRGAGARRDSMGRYSSEGGMDEHTKEELIKMIEKM